MADTQKSVLQTALETFQQRNARYQVLRNYYDGRHPFPYSSEKYRNAFGQILQGMRDNLMPSVVDAVADRLELEEFAVEDLTPEHAAAVGVPSEGKQADAHREQMEGLAAHVWRENRMDRQAGEVHQEALKCGDAYVIVWPDPTTGQPVFFPQRADQVTLRYDVEDPRRVLWAAKAWRAADGQTRLNLYYPSRIEKYVTSNKPEALPQKEQAFTLLETPTPNTFGVVPVFHFSNNAALGSFGKSELVDVTPIQDALNKSVLDLLVAMEFDAFRQRWVTGLETEVDDLTGKPKLPFDPGVDRLWVTSSETAKFGDLGASDLSQFLKVSDSLRMEMARITGTPLHYFMLLSGEPPSGEALKTLEARLIKRVRDRQVSYGNSWEDAIAFALRILGHPGVRLSAKWIDPAPRSEKEHTETLLNKQSLGVSGRQLLRELEYTEEEIEQMEAEKAEDTRNLGGALLRSMNRGEVGGEPSGGPMEK